MEEEGGEVEKGLHARTLLCASQSWSGSLATGSVCSHSDGREWTRLPESLWLDIDFISKPLYM